MRRRTMDPMPLCAALALASLIQAGVFAAEWHVAPAGRADGDGSLARPWDLAAVLAHPQSVKGGDTIWLHGGRYGTGGTTRFVSRLSGTAAQPIIVRQAVGERAIVDGGLQGEGSYVWWWGFEITNSSPDRRNLTQDRPTGINFAGTADGNKVINMIIHNVGHPGIGFWNQSTADCTAEIYGTLVWACGLFDTRTPPGTPPGTPQKPWLRGSGTYTQNEVGTIQIHDCIWFWNFTTGINAYGERGPVKGYDVRGNIGFNNHGRDLWFATVPGGSQPNRIERLLVAENCTYTSPGTKNRGGAQAGYKGDHKDVVFRDNYIMAGHNGTTGMVFLRSFQAQTFTGNTIIGPGVLADNQVGQAAQTSTWDRNVYHGGQDTPGKPFHLNNTPLKSDLIYTFAEWKRATGFDEHSTWSAEYPRSNVVFIRPNRYEVGRAHIAVYNWERKDAVAVDGAKIGLKTGDRFEVRDVQNYFGEPVLSGTYAGGAIEIPMKHTATSPISPIAGLADIEHMTIRHSSEQFGAFMVLRRP